MEKQKYAVPALDKCFEIMEFLASSGKASTQAEIAKGISRSTNQIYRILVNLTENGYLTRDEFNGKYALSFKLYNLSRSISPLDEIRKQALPLMEDLAVRCQLSCQLFVLYQSQTMVLVQAKSPYSVSLNYAEGSRFSSLISNPGNVLLAHSNKDVQQMILRNEPSWQTFSEKEKRAFGNKLDTIAEAKQLDASSQHILGITESVCLVGQHEGKQIAALMISHLSHVNEVTDNRENLTLLRETANRLTTNLGL
ncbi:IclR family transcriptional regulator [Alteromonas stellipolaris]|uniref:IclR family transcriptional regulator n=1 Tax=Alteromonas stellipolaris TaxID=233316 RepID=UPI0026E1BE29|nr:helix-turn-helix domain-containing protein [Alteromonas stellipolaris]MDO6536403.1 helix-turn-helix domain-containing protein [Alteromonas stellipolaris]MDO6624725.1 helix-turn-helix domain-containing protein [Alteromonas stellipolaris]